MGRSIRQPPFSFPAVAAEGDVVAFLEPEPAQGDQDENHNGQVFETILRVFRLGGGELISDGAPITADGAPLINRRSLLASNGRVFFRTSEGAVAREAITLASAASDLPTQQNISGEDGLSISADSRFDAFASRACPLGCFGQKRDIDVVFVRDRLTGVTERVSVASNLVLGDTNVCVTFGGGGETARTSSSTTA
jgi:hypothetical protein